MKTTEIILSTALALAVGSGCTASQAAPAEPDTTWLIAQAAPADNADPDSRPDADAEALKIAALEGLMAASPERALPVVRRVLQGNHSDEVKTRALFVLGQIDSPESHEVLLGFARDANNTLHAGECG